MNKPINVNIKNNDISYPIYIERNEISALAESINRHTQNAKRLIVISKKVYSLYKKQLNFPSSEILILKDGEDQKNIKNYLKIIDKARKLSLTRKDYIVAIGGGVIGDIAGFAASTYMRGIKYIQVPTTLLAFVDSSVGGKTAIDLPNGKNYIGTFYQPEAVYINLNFLKTLDKKQLKSGFGEVIKYAFIENSCGLEEDNALLLEFLTVNSDRILQLDFDFLEKIIRICLSFKISVVQNDEKEAGLRKILNLGHTYAHALESITNYKKYTHGQAVIYGLMFIFNYALENKYINDTYYRLAFQLFEKYGFKPLKALYFKKQIIELMLADKKSTSKINFVVPTEKRKASVIEVENPNTLNFKTNFLLK